MRFVARMFVLFPLLWVEGMWAVECPSTSYDIRDQAALDALGVVGCDSVSGNLRIHSSSDISNLDALSALISVGGDLRIEFNNALDDVSGLVNLVSVGGSFYFNHNNVAANLDGLTGLASVGDSLIIGSNASLQNVDGMIGLTGVGSLSVNNNGVLQNLDGLSNIQSAPTIWIGSNDTITDLDGLAGVVGEVAQLAVDGNDSLVNLDGAIGITGAETLWITNNPSLRDISGLASLVSFGTLYVTGNDVMTNLDSLSNVTGTVRGIDVRYNDSLNSISGLAGIISVQEHVIISDELITLDGFEALQTIGGNLDITSSLITDVDALSNLQSVGGALYFSGNEALTNLDGLVGLEEVGEYLALQGNTSLTNLNGLVNVASIGGDLNISSNSNLTDCKGLAPVLGWPSGSPEDDVNGSISIQSNNGSGCNSIEEILASVSGPTQPMLAEATTSSDSILLSFSPSISTDTLFPITGYSASCTGSDVDVSGSPATDLLDNTPITETLTVTGFDPTSVLSSIEVDIDITHSDPTDLYITLTTPEGTELVLWNQGSTGGEDLVGTFPTTLTAVDSLNSVTRQTMDGDWVLSIEDINVGPLVREGVLNSWGIRITEELARNASGSPIEVFGATRGRDYACTVAPVTRLGPTPVSNPYTVSVPLELPSVPTITSTDYEDGKIILTVSVSDNGGTDITGYDATCTDGTNTFTGTSTSSPITVSGLTNDVAYTCTVTATNSVGTSSASAATGPIIPEEIVNALPIWLLYQATQ